MTDATFNQTLAAHFHARRHHRLECRCPACSWSGREACEEGKPCGDCRELAERGEATQER